MSKIFKWIKSLFQFLRRKPKPETQQPEIIETRARWSSPVLEEAKLTFPNRSMRRALERARRRHDKFVEPSGPTPRKRERRGRNSRQAAPLTVELPERDPNDIIIADEWMHGDGTKVLFEESEIYGEFNFRDTILGQLDRYWIYLERMRLRDPQAYGFYKQMGATLLPYFATTTNMEHCTGEDKTYSNPRDQELELSPWFRQHLPSFGCVAVGINEHDEKREMTGITKKSKWWVVKFLYFTRLKRTPWDVQPMWGGTVYQMIVWWDRPQDPSYRRKGGTPEEYFVWISSDGKDIRPLKVRRSHKGSTAWWDWRFPYGVEDWCREKHIDVRRHISRIFCDATRAVERSYYAMVRVEVKNGDLTAVFGISPRRTAYFFQDRDVTLTRDGFKEPIFHMVRPHVRKNGAKVPAHFRGLRDFEWAGYQVSITIPGKDYFHIGEFNVPTESSLEKKKKDEMDMPEIAEWLRSEMKAGTGKHA